MPRGAGEYLCECGQTTDRLKRHCERKHSSLSPEETNKFQDRVKAAYFKYTQHKDIKHKKIHG